MPKAKKPKFYTWKCPKCGMIRISRKGLPPAEFEMLEKERRKGVKVFSCETEICPQCQIPLEQQEGWMY